MGMWQFMINTGKIYDLKVDSYVDERCDVHQSTQAACEYLKYLHGIYDNWELALAAYNCGPGNVNRAIRRAGGVLDYWKVYDYLPRETRGYVPAFIAVNYVFAHAAEYNLYPVVPAYCAYEVDTVQVCYPIDLRQLAQRTGGNEQEILALNPMFKRGIVPDLHQPVSLYLPKDQALTFIAREEELKYCYNAVAATEPAPPVVEVRSQTHVVRSGESLGLIAQRNGVGVSQLKDWNNLRGDQIKPGQRLVIQRPVNNTSQAAIQEEAAKEPVTQQKTNTSGNVEYIYHVVQPGDTLWDIARKYPGVTVEQIKQLNSGLNSKRLHPGKRIKVGIQG